MITTTLNRIRAKSPCKDGWDKLLKGLGKTQADDEPLPFATILAINGIDDTLWCLRVEPQYEKEWRLFAVWCGRRFQHLMKDERSVKALDVAERYVHGHATIEELRAAKDAAREAAESATDAAEAATDAAREAMDDALIASYAWYIASYLWYIAMDPEWGGAWGGLRVSAKEALIRATDSEALRLELEAQRLELLRIFTETEARPALEDGE